MIGEWIHSYIQGHLHTHSSSVTHSTDTFYGIICSGLTDRTKLSFTSVNSSFSECVRKHSLSSLAFVSSISNDSPDTCRENCSFTRDRLTLSSSATFTSCEWKSCEGNKGGAIYTNKAGTSLTITLSYFEDCFAPSDYGGAVASEFLENVYIYYSTFYKCHGQAVNDYDTGGGAVYLNDTQQWHQIHDCNFIGCYSGADGGAVHLRNCDVPHSDGIANTRFIDCKTTYIHDCVEGGAVQSYTVAVTCAFSNCLLAKCHSWHGGGLFLHVKDNSYTNMIWFCFFHENTVTGNGPNIAIIRFVPRNDRPLLQHCFCTSSPNTISYNMNGWNTITVDWLLLANLATEIMASPRGHSGSII